MRLSRLLCAALGAALVYYVLTREKKEGDAADAAADDAGTAQDPSAAEAPERRRVRAGQPVVDEQPA